MTSRSRATARKRARNDWEEHAIADIGPLFLAMTPEGRNRLYRLLLALALATRGRRPTRSRKRQAARGR